jgi:hypothetical protein
MAILHSKERPFLKLKNRCGPMKSAYAENMLNYVLLLRTLKQPTDGRKPLPIEHLDNYFDGKLNAV